MFTSGPSSQLTTTGTSPLWLCHLTTLVSRSPPCPSCKVCAPSRERPVSVFHFVSPEMGQESKPLVSKGLGQMSTSRSPREARISNPHPGGQELHAQPRPVG